MKVFWDDKLGFVGIPADDLPDEWETERQSSGESTLLRIPRELVGELAAALNQSELDKEVTETENKTR